MPQETGPVSAPNSENFLSTHWRELVRGLACGRVTLAFADGTATITVHTKG